MKFGEIVWDDISKIKRIMKSRIPEYKEKNIIFKLIYDASKDGHNSSNCHSKCNNVPNTLSLIETKIIQENLGFLEAYLLMETVLGVQMRRHFLYR